MDGLIECSIRESHATLSLEEAIRDLAATIVRAAHTIATAHRMLNSRAPALGRPEPCRGPCHGPCDPSWLKLVRKAAGAGRSFDVWLGLLGLVACAAGPQSRGDGCVSARRAGLNGLSPGPEQLPRYGRRGQ